MRLRLGFGRQQLQRVGLLSPDRRLRIRGLVVRRTIHFWLLVGGLGVLSRGSRSQLIVLQFAFLATVEHALEHLADTLLLLLARLSSPLFLQLLLLLLLRLLYLVDLELRDGGVCM